VVEHVIVAVDAARWPGPAGWFYRGLLDNVLASAVWGPVGLVVGAAWEKRHVIRPIHRRLDDHQQSLDSLHGKTDQIHTHLGITTPNP
jgi:hypothetical protein